MANTRILAMSNMIDSFTSSSHAKQGFYGKQLKVIGSCSSSPSTMGAELDLIIKVLERGNDSCYCSEQDQQVNRIRHHSPHHFGFFFFF